MKIFFFIEYKNNNFKNHILKNNFEDEFLLSFLGSDGEELFQSDLGISNQTGRHKNA